MGIPPKWYSNFLHLVNSLYSFFWTEASFYIAIDKTFRDLGDKNRKMVCFSGEYKGKKRQKQNLDLVEEKVC